MTTRTDDSYSRPIESRADLLSLFEGGEKARDDWRIGTEHEKFVYRMDDHRAPSWEEPGGIRDLLMGLTEFGWEPVEEDGKVIALVGPYKGSNAREVQYTPEQWEDVKQSGQVAVNT